MSKIKIGLFDVDWKEDKNIYNVKKTFPNLALMKISSYYKSKGDEVEWYSPLFHSTYDKVFASKVYTFKSEKDKYLSSDMIMGGSGIDIVKTLPEEIEHCYPDYNLYNIDYALGFMTRGCIRNCKFCIVREKEGNIRFNAHLSEFCKEQKKVRLLDNNILAYKNHLDLLKELRDSGKRIEFNQGLDIRLLNERNVNVLSELKRWGRFTFAFDSPNLLNIIKKKLILLEEYNVLAKHIQFYVLIGFNTNFEEDLMRFNFLRDRNIRAYAMIYNRFSEDPKVKALRDWVNYKPLYFTFTFKEFLNRKKEIRKGKKGKVIKKKHSQLIDKFY